ncbi:MAG TPA: FecR family protein [Polyangia bacterium]|nr:FecR family protein [Polyangia bacterium]
MARPEDEALERLVELTRATLSDEATRHYWPADESGLRRLEAGGRPRGRLRWQAMTAVGFAALLLVAAPAAWFAVRSPGPLTFEVINGTVGAAGEISPGEGTRIRFSDGSEVALDRDARAQVSDLTPVGARIVLSNGRAHTFFVHKPRARWQVAAGPYVVQVTGTIFDVQWSSDNEAFDVWLQKGSVRVSGPLIGDGIAMTRGQHLRTRVKDNKISLDDQRADAPEAPPAAAPPPTEPAPAPAGEAIGHVPAAEGSATDEVAPPAHIPARVTHPASRSWSRRMARGDFEAVVEAAERRGIESVLARGSHAELAALADAARYTRRNRLASRALNAERDRFADTAEGREAAFFLGNVAEDGGDRSGAISWYGRYLREDAAGTYAAQALGRKMLLESRRASPAAAIDAEEYLHRFPSGSYAEAARLILKQ